MKKLLFSLLALVMPFVLSAQLLDTIVVFQENFDGDVVKMTTTNLFGEPNWRKDSSLYVSSPASFHTPSYPTVGNCASMTRAIEVDRSYPYVYLQFDQICKVNNNDRSNIAYQVSTNVSPQGDIDYTSFTTLVYTVNSPFYHGHAEVINEGNVSQNWYTDWQKNNNAAVPNNSWWKTELFDLSQFVVGDNNQYFRLRFLSTHNSGAGSGTEVCAGWYIDNVKVIYSNVELVPPEITLTNTTYINNNGQTQNKIFSGTINDFTGPFVVNATLTDNDAIDTSSVLFWYETSTGESDTIANTMQYYQLGYGQVAYNWTIPMQCYGTTITYHIYVKDVHGSSCYETRTFTLNTTQSLAVNDAKMEPGSFQLPMYPDRMTTGQTYPIKVVFRNKGLATETNPNHMTSATFGWSVNGVQQPSASWTGDLCLDYTDTIVVGNHVALRDSNYIRVWVSSRNNVTTLDRRTDDTITYDGYGCDSALSGTYTLGGPTANFPTVRYMKERFYRCGFGGPVTININPGTYTGFDFDDQYPGLDSNNTITFQAAPGVNRSAVIIANNGNNPPVKFTEMAYVTIRNVTIRNTNVGRCVEFVGKYSHDITIDNCDIQGVTSTATPYYNSTAIGRISTAAPFTSGGSGDRDMHFTNNTISGVNFGFYFTGTTNNAYKEDNFEVNGNTINCTVTGINAIQAKRWTINGNRINQMATAADMDFKGVALQNCTDFASISANKIHMNQRGGTGIATTTYAGSNASAPNMMMANNEIIGKVTVTARYNINLQNTKQVNLYHNSSYMYSPTDITQSAPLYITGSSSSTNNINVYNNIFYNASTSAENKNYAIYLNYTTANALATTIKLDYNEYYSVGTSLGWFVAPRNNFAEWQNALASRGEDVNSVSMPLGFVSTTDSLMPIAFEGLECEPVTGVTTDIRGAQRYNFITYMGCYTRAIPATDLAITELTSPVLGNECPSTQYPIKVMVKNTGSANLNFATKPTTIYYTIGTTTGSMTVTSGTIAPLQSQEVTVVPNFPVNINTIYNYMFVVRVNGDNNTLNDTLTGSFEIQAAFPYYEEVFSTNDLYPSWRFEQIGNAGAGNWTVQLGAGTYPNISPSYGLGRLFFNSKVFANNTESRAIMPVTILQGASTPIMEYWFAHDNSGSSNSEGVTVKISTDGGTTYTAVNSVNTAGTSSTLVKRYNNAYTTPGWEKYMVDLAPYSNQSCIYIAFDAKSNAKNNINIDRVVVRNFHNNDLAVNDIWALGANPTQYEVSPRIYANISNEGRNTQTNFKVMLEITGANTYRDTITVPSLASRRSMVVSFNGVHLNNNGDNVVRVYCASDMNNDNNEHTWLMTTTANEVGYANDSIVAGQHVTYSTVAVGGTGHIAYVNKYNMVDTLIATHVKAYITNTANNSNVGRHFRFVVADASGNIIESSDTMTVTAAMENQWVMGEINNFALTSTNGPLYVGIDMIDGGTYLGVQEEAPLRDTTYYTLTNGTYTPSTVGRQMVNAILESHMPHEVAMLSLEHPLTNCDLGHEHIVVKLTNNGSTDLLPGTPIHYSINGGAPVNATITNTIASHETVDYTFTTEYDFTNNQVNVDVPYTIAVWVDVVSGDRVRPNDTLSVTIQSYGKSPMPTVVSPVHANYHEPATLTATDVSGASSSAQFWYTNSGYESWDLQYVGNPFITPAIYYDTTYYVASAPATFYTPQVGTVTTTASNNITQPFVFTKGFSRGKILYKGSELNANGQLTRIELYVATAAAATGDQGIPMRMYVMNTDLDALTASPVSTWDDEIANATLIYDGNYFFNTTGWVAFNLPVPFDYEGGNIIILTETYCGGNNCAAASGSTGYPAFNSTAATNCVLYKSVNGTTPNYTGNYSTFSKRLNMKFQFVDADCQSEKVPVQVIADNVPVYDVEPVELVSPTTNTCTLLDENIVVTVRNLINNTIPANTVEVVAKFNNNTVTHIIDEPFAPNEVKTVTFTNTVDLSAPTADVTYSYEIITNLIGTPAYRGNDTLRDEIVSKKTYSLPADTVVEGEYLQYYTIPCQSTQTPRITKWFYENAATGTVTTVTANPYSFTTPDVLYDTAVYYVYGLTPNTSCTTRHMRYQINVQTPLHDLSTNGLVAPVSYQCGISNANLKVNVSNTWPTANTIPAGTFKLKANFTGSSTLNSEHTISQPVTSDASVDVVFGNAMTLGSATQNNIYNYVIYSNPVNPNMYVYRNNDTISGTLYVPATPATPANMTTSAPYGGTATVTPTGGAYNQYYFYDQPTGGTALAQGMSFTTPPIVANPTLFYYSGRIMDSQNFAASTTVGTASLSNNSKPFDFTKEHSAGIIMYTKDELGFSAGIIDTVFLYVHTVGSGNIPMKLYLKNDSSFVQTASGVTYPNLTPQLMNTVYQNKWNNALNNAVLIADNLEFNQTGWYAFVIPGGFHYTGNSLLLLAEHHGKGSSLGYTAPVFRSTTVPNVPNSTYNKRVISYATDNAFNPATSVTYSQATIRFNTKFSIGYTCESAGRGVITVNTVLPNIDLDVEAITAPVTPNNAYTNNETVTVQLSNHGANTANNYSLSYQLEGEAPVTVTNPVNITSGNTVTYSFTTSIDLSTLYFPRTFKVYVTCTADNNHSNDTLTIVLTKDLCTSGSLTAASPSIANVKFGGIDNLPLPAGWSPFNSADTVSYTDYSQTVAPAVLVKGQTYPFSVTNAFTGNSGVKLFKYVFIDFDHSGTFAPLTGANSERVINYTSGSTFNNQHPENATTEGLITVPQTASEGITLMRVVASTSSATEANSGCGYYAQGETEDYAVLIRGSFDNDLAVVGYLQPAGNSCPDNRANIKVYVRNYGTNTMTFTAANPMELTAEVSGVIPGTYTALFSTGSIAAGETKTYTIPGVNLSTAGNYSVVTRLNFADDEYTVNNFWKTSFTIGNLTVDTVAHLETFDETITDPDAPFTSFWHLQSSSAAYKWTINKGQSPNNPNAGPDQDHTTTNTLDQYATVLGKTNQTSTTAYASLTTNCIDLHYRNGYPIQMDYWEHIFGQTNATGTLLVQVGTGDNFVTVDSVVGPIQTSFTSSWKNRLVMFSDNDEVAKVRFRTKAHTRMMDIAIDDVNFGYGLPDIGIAEQRGYLGIIYPTDFNDSTASCMIYGDTVHPIVAIANTGLTPIVAFDIKGTWKTGNEIIEYVEHWEAETVNGVVQPFMPGDTMEYRFTNTYTVFTSSSSSDFTAELILALDKDPWNNKATVHPCASTGVEDYVKENGLLLYQNVPNPAETKTRISFIAPRAGQAVVEIFSLTGQKLFSETVNAQYGENYLDVTTSSFAAGMYIYTLQFEDAVLSKKMVIQK